MGRPKRIPERGDVPPAAVAHRLGLSLPDFRVQLPVLQKRGFPSPDPTTGQFCIEAVDRWRLNRHPFLFPELTNAHSATHAGIVFNERRQRLFGQN